MTVERGKKGRIFDEYQKIIYDNEFQLRLKVTVYRAESEVTVSAYYPYSLLCLSLHCSVTRQTGVTRHRFQFIEIIVFQYISLAYTSNSNKVLQVTVHTKFNR
jgi:hypothetical protein